MSILLEAVDIKLLADNRQHIPYLAQLQYEKISKHWVTNASLKLCIALFSNCYVNKFTSAYGL